MVYKKADNFGISSSKLKFSREYNYCKVCYHKTIIDSTRGSIVAHIIIIIIIIPSLIMFILFSISLFGTALSLDSHFGPISIFILLFGIPFVGIPLFIIFALIYVAFVKNPKKTKESKIELQLFLDETGMIDNIDFEIPAYYKISYKK